MFESSGRLPDLAPLRRRRGGGSRFLTPGPGLFAFEIALAALAFLHFVRLFAHMLLYFVRSIRLLEALWSLVPADSISISSLPHYARSADVSVRSMHASARRPRWRFTWKPARAPAAIRKPFRSHAMIRCN